MKIQKPAVAGTLESSDAQVTVEPGEGSLELSLSSSVMNQYGRQIKATVLETLEHLGVTDAPGDRGGQGGPGLHPEGPGGVRGVPQLRGIGAEYSLGRCCAMIPRPRPERFRLRRTMMFMNAQKPGLIKDAYIYGCDSIMLDLEDAVAENQKDAARFSLYHALKSVDYGDTEVIVRINGLDTPHWQEDVRVCVAGGADGIRIAKCESAQDVKAVEAAVEAPKSNLAWSRAAPCSWPPWRAPRGFSMPTRSAPPRSGCSAWPSPGATCGNASRPALSGMGWTCWPPAGR